MKSRDFCYWLQGFFELYDSSQSIVNKPRLDLAQVECIKNHLAMVFAHEIDPSFGGKEQQSLLDSLHSGKPDSVIMRC